MFEVRENERDELVGAMVSCHKKRTRDQVNNFWGEVCLLSMCSRVLGRVIAKRVGWWAEHLKLLGGNCEAKEVRIDCMLFADVSTVVGTKWEMDESVRQVKEVMGRWDERNNEDKEEMLEFGTEEGEEVRVLRSWMEDLRNNIKRAGMMWGDKKWWLKGSRVLMRWQGTIVQCASVCGE